MKRQFRRVAFICSMIMVLSLSTTFAAGEKSLAKDPDWAASYGNYSTINEKDTEIIKAIKKAGKTDFKDGFYADFRPWYGEMYPGSGLQLMGPGSSEQYVTINNIQNYDKLVFDVCAISREKFGDLESTIYWHKYDKYEEDSHSDFDTYMKDFTYTEGSNDKFTIEKVAKGEYPDVDGIVQIHINDEKFNSSYVVVASNQWERVELDISKLDNMIFYFSINGSASVLVANPKLISTTGGQTVKELPKLKATPSSSTVLVDDEAITFDAYKINDNNYFKLRDLAKVLNGSEKQFEVTWDEDTKSINLLSATNYTVVGGELDKGDGVAKEPIESKSSISKDGEVINLKAYTIGGNNYFKLRDIGKTFDFGVDWDNDTQTIKIDTRSGYIE